MRAVRLMPRLMPLSMLSVVVACGSRGEPLAVSADIDTVVSAYGSALAIEGREVLSPARAFGVDEAVRVYLYPQAPAALFFGVLPEGLAPAGALSEPLPATDEAFAWVPAVQAWTPLSASDERPHVVARAVRCAAQSGCVVASGACEVPCPARPEPAAPVAPQAVRPPQLRPCPPLWREVVMADGVEACEAPEVPLASPCSGPRRTRRVDGMCVEVGAPCADPSLRVPPGRGRGLVVAPGQLDAALDTSADDDVLLLGAGEWTLSRPLLGRRLLLGRCAAQTRVRGLVDARGDVGVDGLTLAGSAGDTTVFVAPGARLGLEGVVVEAAGAHAVRVEGGQLRLRDGAIRGGTRAALELVGTSSVSLGAASLDNDLGAGLRLEAGAQLHATDVRLRVGAELAVRSEGAAIQLDRVDVLHGGPMALHLTASSLRATGLRVTGGSIEGGRALVLDGATTATLSASAVLGVVGRAVHAERAALVLEDVWVHDAVEAVVGVEAVLALRRVRLDGLRGVAIQTLEGRLTAHDLWVHSTLADPTLSVMPLNGPCDLTRTVVWATGTPAAIVALTRGGVLRDLRVEGPPESSAPPTGILQTQGAVRLERALLRGSLSFALALGRTPDAVGSIDITDLTISATVARNAIYLGACYTMTLERASVEGRSRVAVAFDADSLCLADRVVGDLRVRGAADLGLSAAGPLRLQRLDIEGSAVRIRGTETFSAEFPVRVALEDVRVDVRDGRAAALTFTHRTARLTVDRFSLAGRVGVDLTVDELLSFDDDPSLRVRLSEGRITAGAAGLQLRRSAVWPGLLDELLSGVDVRTFLVVEP